MDGVEWTGSAAPQEPIPVIDDNATKEQVENALEGSADAGLKTHIIDATTYNEYRAWANNKIGDADAVKSAANAWLSFALKTDALIENAPSDGDLKVEKFEPSAESGKYEFTISVKDIEVGSDAAEAQLKEVFGLEGATTLDDSAFSADNVGISFGTPENGNVKFTAEPKDKTATSFFMKVKMK